LAKCWPSGAIVSAEAGIVLGSHGMGKDSLMRYLSLLNVLWDGGSVNIDRRSKESFNMRNARATVALQVQEDTLRSFLDQSGVLARSTGFLARFLVAWPESTQGFRLFAEAPANWPALDAFNRRIAEILANTPTIDDDGALTPPLMRLSTEAKSLWVAYHDAIERKLAVGGELHQIRDVASKSADNAARLAALFQVFEGARGAIEPDAFESASRVAAWHLHEARRFFGELALPEEQANAARLDNWLTRYCRRKNATAIPRREVQQCVTPARLRTGRVLDAALSELENAERVRITSDGRHKDVRVNPKLLVDSRDGAR
jgi:putative DNA primase/helicase